MTALDPITGPPANPLTAGHAEMIAWRHDFHRHPELAFAEHRTAARVAELLRGFGVDEVTEGVGRTGVVGVINGTQGAGATVGLRADMDALPVVEATGLDYASTHAGVMHACGHDGHTTMLLGAARHLAERRDFPGRVVLIFQPAEEGRAGAREMLQDGLQERWPMDSVFGLHNMPGVPAGKLVVSPGPVMAAADRFDITVRGQGGHAALPERCRDPVVAASALVQALQTVRGREVAPDATLVLSVTRIQGGEAFNIIPDAVELSGTVRYFDPGMGEVAEAAIGRIAQGIAAAHRVEIETSYRRGYPPTINHEGPADLMARAAADLLGAENSGPQPRLMVSEDFSFLLERIPGAYAFLGNGGEGGEGGEKLGACGLHAPTYDFNDAILPAGAGVLAQVARVALEEAAGKE
ncbi:amidohydrolase [Roseospirillum parvum]|uniref:Hippurate hydrolase n=1 Tax=Roseospirillum parvum TaxID=83401 RepID=A0A1G8E910_9PROT|nr:amidohydrolase [Roseospirillum parvum]SDH66428.1 hippurate hydrolase [Roseospirillum parvum]